MSYYEIMDIFVSNSSYTVTTQSLHNFAIEIYELI